FIPMHTIYGSLTRAKHNTLLPVYGIKGCHTVSTLLGHGKKKAFRIMMKDADTFQTMATLEDTTKLGDGEKATATKSVSCLYRERTFCGSLNELRCEQAEKGNAAKKLPPDESFMLHLLRCLYQVFIWKHTDIGMLDVPSPIHFGHEKEVGCKLRPKLMSQSAAAPELLIDLVCDCTSDLNIVPFSCIINLVQQPVQKKLLTYLRAMRTMKINVI
ncbi:UNVERIFIED_CONTAM: hypothetical protein FKN15_038612, partial [Acipenser sinensis]